MAAAEVAAEVVEHWEGGEGQALIFHPHAVSGSSFCCWPLQLLIKLHIGLVSLAAAAAAVEVEVEVEVESESVQDAVAQVSLFRSLRYVSCNSSLWRKRSLCISPCVVSAAVEASAVVVAGRLGPGDLVM